ncbi:MAG: alpha/beta fold hydrolase [Lascolabacillus sp.]|uniref:alpha/beta hydrolase family protein n=1 Tax=Lascolabacillus sp. TaxID=1924068 RepID=UPI00258C63F6|nr:alpha/beta fold hydrolase [Lascolabacillus sp.]MDD3658925.1 alpha/beta fold hydrolase [Lascolabacillus sp.]
MNKAVFYIFLFLLTGNLYSQEIIGSWTGSLKIQETSLRLVFNVSMKDSVLISTFDSPDQGAFGLPTTRTTYSESDKKLEIIASGLGIFYRGILENDSIVGTFNQGGIPFPLTLRKTIKEVVHKPQTPIEPLPYISEEVTIPDNSQNKVSLSGTLTLPDSTGIFPAIILIAGSGPNDRDETIFGHKPFYLLSDYLTRNGFAVLRYDKRGVGKSTGDYSKATISDFVTDASNALEYLKSRKEIDSSKIGMLGHSEGGIIAPMVASKSSDVKFLVLLAAPGTKGIEIVLDQNENSLKHQGIEPETINRLQLTNREIFESLLVWSGSENDRTALRDRLSYLWEQLPILIKLKLEKEPYLRAQFNAMITPGYRSFLATDPKDYLSLVSCPVLAINGENDVQVPALKNLEAIKHHIQKGGNYKVETKSYPLLNHLFQESITGQPDEYAKIDQTISPQILSDITNWIKSKTE